jgi:hypothetical protein
MFPWCLFLACVYFLGFLWHRKSGRLSNYSRIRCRLHSGYLLDWICDLEAVGSWFFRNVTVIRPYAWCLPLADYLFFLQFDHEDGLSIFFRNVIALTQLPQLALSALPRLLPASILNSEDLGSEYLRNVEILLPVFYCLPLASYFPYFSTLKIKAIFSSETSVY